MKKRKLNFKNILLFAILILAIIFTGVFFAFQKTFNQKVRREFKVVDNSNGKVVSESSKDRLNILILGMEGTRTDMIMLGTFDPKSKTLNFISIPRDTYVENNYKDATLKKINSVYEIPSVEGGVERLASEVSKILGIPVHDYVKIDYNAVAEITDAVGGVDINIPFNMYYDDPYSKPPLHIYFQKGTVHLDGSNAIKYLRWRKNNDGSYGQEGDEGRIKRQQIFIRKVLEKALTPTTLPKAIEVAFENVETSLELSQVMGLVKDALLISKDNIKFFQEIGTPSYFNGLWYYLADKESTQALMQKIFNNTAIEDKDLNPSREFEAEALSRGNDSGYIRPQIEEEEETPSTSQKTVEDTQAQDIIFGEDEQEEDSSETENNQNNNSNNTNNQNNQNQNINSNNQDNSTNNNQNNNQTQVDNRGSVFPQEPSPSTSQETPTEVQEPVQDVQAPPAPTEPEPSQENVEPAPIF